MSIKAVIQLQESQVDSYVKFITKEQSDILEEIVQLQKRYKDNENTIAQLTVKPIQHLNGKGNEQIVGSGEQIEIKDKPTTVGTGVEYDSKLSWWNKVVFVLKSRKKGTYAKDILKYLYELDAELKGDISQERKNSVNVYALLSTKAGQGKLKRIRVKGEYLYGFPEWFNEDGRLKEGFK